MNAKSSISSATDILAFWREAGAKSWFAHDPDFDRAIAERFGEDHLAATRGDLAAWEADAEGTLALDYPFVVTSGAADRRKAAGLLEQDLTTERAQEDVRALGFRTTGGRAPAAFAEPGAGVDPHPPLTFSPPGADDVRATMQAWLRLTLVSRVLNLLDISGSMGERVPGTNLTRIQALAQVSQQGLAVEPDDTQMGVWTFSTDLVGKRLGESGLREKDITVLTLHRGTQVIPNPFDRHVLEAEDRLLCFGKLEEMRSMIPARPKRRARVKKLPKKPILED